MRIATWNLDHASNSSRPIDLQVAAIGRIAPDVIILTETDSRVDLSTMGYAARCAQPNKYQKHYVAIWSRWQFGPTIQVTDPVLSTCTTVETPNGPMILFGTILTYRDDKGPSNTSGPWIEHERAIVVQGGDWDAIRKKHESIPMIIAGDFNQARDGKGMYKSLNAVRLLDEQLDKANIHCVTEEDFGAAGKISVDPKTGYYRHNIDHICVSKGHFAINQVSAWDHFVDHDYLSDHNGVYADLAFRD